MDLYEPSLLHELMALAQWRVLRSEAESLRVRREATAELACIDAHQAQAAALTERYDAYRRGDGGIALTRALFDGMAALSGRIDAAHSASRASLARLEDLRRRASDLSRDIARQEERAACYRRMADEAASEEDSDPGDA